MSSKEPVKKVPSPQQAFPTKARNFPAYDFFPLTTPLIQRAQIAPHSLSPHDILHLQHAFGNQKTQRMLAKSQGKNAPEIAKLTPSDSQSDMVLQHSALPGGMTVQRRLIQNIDGNAPDEEKEFIHRRWHQFVNDDPEIAALSAAQDVWVHITLNRDRERGDQETRSRYLDDRQRTLITITLNQAEDDTPEQLASDLLHEVVLHALPAYRKHVAARQGQTAPDFPGDDDEDRITLEELQEHGNVDAWFRMARIAMRSGQWAFFQRTLSDFIAHAQEAGLSDDDEMALGAIHSKDWDYLRQEGYL